MGNFHLDGHIHTSSVTVEWLAPVPLVLGRYPLALSATRPILSKLFRGFPVSQWESL